MQRRQVISLVVMMASFVGASAADGPEYPAHVQHLIDSISNGPEVTVRRFQESQSVAQGVPADNCIIKLTWETDFSEAELRKLDRLDTLSPAERQELLDRTREHTIQIWWVPLAHHPVPGEDFKSLLKPYPIAGEEARPVIHLGNDDTYAWYAAFGTMRWGLMQKALDLEGGDDPVAYAEAYLASHAPGTAVAWRSMITIVYQGQATYMEVTDRLIFEGSRHRATMIEMAGELLSAEVTAWLVDLTTSGDNKVAQAARDTLLAFPRPEAEATYLAWLNSGAGKEDVRSVLKACMALELQSAKPYLQRILSSPHNLEEYILAYSFGRSLEGNPIDDMVDLAASYICGHREFLTEEVAEELDSFEQAQRAVHVLTHTDDVAGAITLAVAMSISNDETVREVGLYTLASTDDQSGRVLVGKLMNCCDDDREAGRLKRVHQVLLAWENANRPGRTPRLQAFAKRRAGGGPGRPSVRPAVRVGGISIGRGGGGPSGAGPTRVQPH